MKKDSRALLSTLQNVYFRGQYNPNNHYVAEVNLLHSANIANVGGEQKFNDANTKVEVGVSDFNGTQIPTDFKGLLNGIAIRYGKHTKTGFDTPPSPALITYKELRTDFPNWALNSEIILKAGGTEALRVRVQELLTSQSSQDVPAEWCKDFLKTIKVIGGQDLELYISSPKGSELSATDYEYLQVTLYGIKFGDRIKM